MEREKKPVGFIGLGAMGMGMARSLLEAGFEVKGYDINPEARARLAQAGGQGVEDCADAAEGVDPLIVMVLNAEQVETVLFGDAGASATLDPGSVVILSSTVAPAYAADLGARLAARDIMLIDAPVSGGTARAASGELSIMASGSPSAFEQAASVLDAMAANLYRMGDECGLGSVMKMINQLLAGVHLATMGEALAFAESAGADLEKVYEVICSSAGMSWMFQNRGPHVLKEDYTPHSAIDIWVKDLGIVLETGRDRRFPLPLSAAAHQLFLSASAQGYGRIDDAAVVKVYRSLAGSKEDES